MANSVNHIYLCQSLGANHERLNGPHPSIQSIHRHTVFAIHLLSNLILANLIQLYIILVFQLTTD